MTIADFCRENEKISKVGIKGMATPLKKAQDMLTENEELLFAAVVGGGLTDINPGVLVITSTRIYQCFQGLLTKTDSVMGIGAAKELYLKDITSVKIKSGLVGGKLEILGITENFYLGGRNAILNKIRDVVNSARSNLQSGTSNESNKSLNYLEELEKLAELKEKGILSEEEFNSKKQEILNNNK